MGKSHDNEIVYETVNGNLSPDKLGESRKALSAASGRSHG